VSLDEDRGAEEFWQALMDDAIGTVVARVYCKDHGARVAYVKGVPDIGTVLVADMPTRSFAKARKHEEYPSNLRFVELLDKDGMRLSTADGLWCRKGAHPVRVDTEALLRASLDGRTKFTV
jgi:hypothetical protein